GQRLRGLAHTFGVNDLGTPFALGLGLAGNRTHHTFVQIDVLDLDVGHLYTPAVGLGVKNFLHVEIELLALGKHFIEIMFAQHGAQGGLGELAGGFQVMLHLNDRLFGSHHPEVNHRAYLHLHVVARNHVLAGNVHGDHAQIDPHDLLQHGNHEDEAGALYAGEAAQRENDAALVFAHDAHGIGNDDHRYDDQYRQANVDIVKHTPLSLVFKPTSCGAIRSFGRGRHGRFAIVCGFDPLHAQFEPARARYAYAVAHAQRLAADHPPVLAADFGIYHAVFHTHHFAVLAHHGLVADNRAAPAAAYGGGAGTNDDHGAGDANGQQEGNGQLIGLGHFRAGHEQPAQHEGQQPADAQRAKRRQEDFADHHEHAQSEQRHAGPVDGQHVQPV